MENTRSNAISLRRLSEIIALRLAVAELREQWVTAELSDVRQSGGHCYMELVEKNPDTGVVESRLRAIIWAGTYNRLAAKFLNATGKRFATGIKLMVCGTINYHPAFGISFIINDIDPSYTMGEAERLRREILRRLKAEGVIDLNRELEWCDVPLRIAIISAKGAAGYGDFINQLYNNERRLKFRTRLFPAVLQGERTVPSVIAALESIAADIDNWDCVVIIRGGGATSDLTSFDNFDLANNIAQFPLPVIVGIGHERDTTVLDFVANMRVKTPTAAAEWLIARGNAALDNIHKLCSDILNAAREKISGSLTHLAFLEGALPIAPAAAIERSSSKLDKFAGAVASLGSEKIASAIARIDAIGTALKVATGNALSRATQVLDSKAGILEALSPEATLRRGFSITVVNGRAARSVADIAHGDKFTTILADGKFTSSRD